VVFFTSSRVKEGREVRDADLGDCRDVRVKALWSAAGAYLYVERRVFI
jgi:hypothetical protein